MLVHNRTLTTSNTLFSGVANSLRNLIESTNGWGERVLEVTISAAFAWIITASVLVTLADSSF